MENDYKCEECGVLMENTMVAYCTSCNNKRLEKLKHQEQSNENSPKGEIENTTKAEPIKPPPALTAEEIADDVQQTYGEIITNDYRKLIQNRINDLLNQERKLAHEGIKRILSHNFTSERKKQRITDPDKNLELLNHLGAALTVIETQAKDDLTRFLVDQEDILSIVPKRDFEE